MDLPALMSRVLSETGFEKLGLICHSQGTTEAFVALTKEQRPDLGDKISVFCALAPAAYAGPLIGKMYFKFMRVISPALFRVLFGIHAFIPFMMTMHGTLPGWLYGALGYCVFSLLFDWSDARWDRGLRDRHFQFAPVYVSAESMRWWLGRDCFARQKCILATREEARREDAEDAMLDDAPPHAAPAAWYDARCPPLALWIGAADDLVDGRRLLRRLLRGREPHVRVVRAVVIDGYEHLDVLWALDAVERVGRGVKEVLWQTCGERARARCRVPRGCEAVGAWQPGEGDGDEADDGDSQSSSLESEGRAWMGAREWING
jgi:pimeloyl-ACP methyl ester carboxylesterase